MFETLIKRWNNEDDLMKTSQWPTLEEAMKYAEDKPGIIAIREVGNESVIWRREDDSSEDIEEATLYY